MSLSRRKVAEHLTVRRPRPAPAVRVAGVEGKAEPLALLDHQGVREPVFRPALPGCPRLGARVGEQQMVGDILMESRGLLGKVVGPPEQLQDGANQFLLRDCLVRVRGTAQCVVPFPNAVPERLECVGGRDRLPPFGRGAYPLGQKVLGKQVTRHVFASCRFRDSPSPAFPSRGIVPCIEAERLGDIPLHPCAPPSRPRPESDAVREHHVFDSTEHVCQNEYILSIPLTGISRSQESANGKRCQQMSGNVRLIVGVTPLLHGMAACRKSVDPPAVS